MPFYTHAILTGTKSTTGSIREWVNDSTIPAEAVLAEAQAWIYQSLRVREMIAINDSFQFDSGASSEALPNDFLDPVCFIPWSYGDELYYVHEQALRRQFDSSGNMVSGTPGQWSIIGTNAHVDVKCSADFAGQLIYYAQPDDLSSGNPSNFLTNRYPTLLRRACLRFAYEFKKDAARMRDEEALAMAAIDDANRTNEMFRRSQRHPGNF